MIGVSNWYVPASFLHLHHAPSLLFMMRKTMFTDLYRNTMWKNLSNRYLRKHITIVLVIIVLMRALLLTDVKDRIS